MKDKILVETFLLSKLEDYPAIKQKIEDLILFFTLDGYTIKISNFIVREMFGHKEVIICNFIKQPNKILKLDFTFRKNKLIAICFCDNREDCFNPDNFIDDLELLMNKIIEKI